MALCGCTLLSKSEPLGCRDESEQPLRLVYVRGELARADALQIPSNGLTLGEAVEATLRPGVKDRLSVAKPELLTNERSVLSVSDERVFEKVREAFAKEGVARSTGIQSALNQLSSSAASQTEEREFGKAFLKVDSITRIFESDELPKQQTAFATLRKMQQAIRSILNSPVDSDARPDLGNRLNASNDLQRAAIKVIRSPSMLSANLAASQVELVVQRFLQPVQITSDPDNRQLLDSASEDRRVNSSSARFPVVKVKHRDGKQRIIELDLIRSTPIGDIQLEDRDQLEVTWLSNTALMQRRTTLANPGVVKVVGLAAEQLNVTDGLSLEEASFTIAKGRLAPAIDLLSLRLPERPAEEYLFRRDPSNARVASAVSRIKLRGGELIRTNAIGLDMEVRRGQMLRRYISHLR